MSELERWCQQHGSPLAPRGRGQCSPDITDWQLFWHPHVIQEEGQRLPCGAVPNQEVLDMANTPLFCCPEDHRCVWRCGLKKRVCRHCEVPVCRDSQLALQANEISPMGTINANFVGYLNAWIYQNDITWMEKIVATPYWTGMTRFSIDRRHAARTQAQLAGHDVRVA